MLPIMKIFLVLGMSLTIGSHIVQGQRLDQAILVVDLFDRLQSPLYLGSTLTNQTILDTITPKCRNDVNFYFNVIEKGQPLAFLDIFSMIDSDGKKLPGVLVGSLSWLGSYRQCMEIKFEGSANFTENGQDVYLQGKFNGQYMTIKIFIVYVPGFTTELSIGMCVPDSCSESDIQTYMSQGTTSVNVLQIDDGRKWDYFWQDTGAVVMLVIILVFFALVLVATVFDMAYVQRLLTQEKEQEHVYKASMKRAEVNKAFEAQEAAIKPENTSTNYYVDKGSEELIPNGKESNGVTAIEMKHVTPNGFARNASLINKPPKYQPGIPSRLLMSFSAYTNICSLMSFDAPKGSYLCLNAIRFLCMCWIVLGHGFQLGITDSATGLTGLNPIPWVTEYYTTFEYKALTNMQNGVEGFFLLSGCLITISFMKAMARQGGSITCRQMSLYYFHRYWRLTPVYMVVLGFMATLCMYTAKGPLWPKYLPDAENCRKNWWWHLLYINNFYDYSTNTQYCMRWSWYLANDFQFYVISPLIFVFLYKIPIVGYIISGILFVGSIVAIVTLHILGLATFGNDYVKPWSRIGSYIVGVWLGYILWKTKSKVKMSRWVAMLGWIFSLGLIFATTFGNWRCSTCTPIPQWLNIMFLSTQRQMTAVGIAWIAFACITGYGGYINTLFSWKGWIPLSRLTYTGYLIHPYLQVYYNYSKMFLQYMRVWPEMVYMFCAYIMLTIGASIILTLVFEMPFLNLEKIIIPPAKKKDK
ncbi:unnamed protein product [Owenia fusiformis]|uniref:Uncharacterized protein n=1 Tax=Owenia fusiformis TaxID=6347 RepID=A0A8J1TUX1_OWEFU|nr:unnamed protein product [Owenia fusiformis]